MAQRAGILSFVEEPLRSEVVRIREVSVVKVN
jgi:hypothetical protein